jgi:hypothetical protein
MSPSACCGKSSWLRCVSLAGDNDRERERPRALRIVVSEKKLLGLNTYAFYLCHLFTFCLNTRKFWSLLSKIVTLVSRITSPNVKPFPFRKSTDNFRLRLPTILISKKLLWS